MSRDPARVSLLNDTDCAYNSEEEEEENEDWPFQPGEGTYHGQPREGLFSVSTVLNAFVRVLRVPMLCVFCATTPTSSQRGEGERSDGYSLLGMGHKSD